MSLFDLLFTTRIPAWLRFRSFSPEHFLLLSVFAGLVLILARRHGARGSFAALRRLALALPCIFIIKFAAFALLEFFVEPQMSLADRLPLHLCAMNALVMPLAVFKRNKLLLNYVYAVALPAAVFAMLTPAMSYYGGYFFLSWQVLLFYIDHALMALVAVLCVKTGLVRPDFRELLPVTGLLASYAAFIFILNKLTDLNFLFLNYPDEGTVMAFFAYYMGNPGYLAALAALTSAVIALMYAPYFIIDEKLRHE